MMEDNIRYTAMRLFQDIQGADVVYVNTYAATTPRLAAFKKICSNNSKEPELVEPVLKSANSHFKGSGASDEDFF